MLSKNLNLCFIKRPETMDPPPPLSPPPSLQDLHHPSSTVTTATASSSSSSLLKTFNSMYDVTPNSTSNKSLLSNDDDFSDSEAEPDFSTVFASTRFFFSSPGRSNSIIESSNTSVVSTATSTTTSTPNSKSSSTPTPTSSSDSVIPGGVPIPTFSPDPYADFRRSMQEMVDDRKLTDVTSGWNYLHELLLCYLALNPKHTHKYIISAFGDLLTSLTADNNQETPALSRNRKPEASSDRCTVE